MKHSLKIRLCILLGTAFLVTELTLLLPSVFATDWRRPGAQREAVEGPRSGGGGGGTSTPSYDYGAAQRAQEAEAERQRQQKAEAERIERERQAEFIRERDAKAGTLKGSSGAAMDQLKVLSGADNSGLKGSGGSGFDTSGTGLKGLQGSDPTSQKIGSLGGSTSKEGGNKSSKNKEECRPSQDPSVVDLCFLGNRPTTIDPHILKGMDPAEKAAIKTSAISMTKNLLPFDKEMYQALADMMGAGPAKTGRQWPGPDNPGARYLNPLTEPEKVKAYWDKVNSGLHAHAEAETKIVTATRKGIDWRDIVARQEADPKFRQAKEQILQNQDRAEGLARHQAFIRFKDFLEKQGGADWPDRIKNDKLFVARMAMEREALFKKMDQEIYGARGKALQQMTALVKGWKEK